MATEKDKRISEVEYCISSYFYTHFAPVMNSVKSKLNHDQAKEIGDYQTSFAGIMSMLANGSNVAGSMVDDSLTILRHTGEHCSKTAEDYVVMCKDAIAGNNDFQNDLLRLAGEWRNAVVAKVGRQRYDAVCEKLGCDLAVAYIDSRIEQLMIDKMVRDSMPKSSFEYVIRKGAENCLIGLPQVMMRSPLEADIEARGEAAYKPSGKEKVAARVVSFGADVVTMGGFSSWGALAKLAGAEVVFAGVEKYLDSKVSQDKSLTVDEIISEAVFGVQGNVLETYRKNTIDIKAYEDAYIQSVNGMMSKRMAIPTEKPFWESDFNPFKDPIDWSKPFSFTKDPKSPWNPAWQPYTNPFNTTLNTTSNNTWAPFSATTNVDRSDIPMPIAPGKEQEYRDWKAAQDRKKSEEKPAFRPPDIPLVIAPGKEQEYLDWLQEQEDKKQSGLNNAAPASVPASATTESSEQSQSQATEQATEEEPTNENSWASLLENFGLNGMGDIARNLPYVIAMLPDMLIGLLTGKTHSVGLKKDMIPIASILLGMFVKNPLLKMVLIGMGGANLLNKMGHEAIDRQHPDMQAQQRSMYRQYEDEPLNDRIKNPVLKGNVLVATIDNVPCTITIPDNAAAACACGALPLNTLANAILARNDRQQMLAEENYRNVQLDHSQDRSQGIVLK